MKKYLEKLPQELQGIIALCSQLSSQSGLRSFLVGGFVRDLILGVNNLDVDIVVECDGIRFAEKLASSLRAGLIRHKRFQTATVLLSHGFKIDIATARSESYPEPACLPCVSNATLEDDLKRRDFTINALALSLNEEDYGKLLDFFEGIKDLRNKRIRILHPLSFIDDPTRMLRAIRFEKRYGFVLEPQTLKLLKEASRDKMLERVQPQRLRDEVILILEEKDPLVQVERIQQLTGWGFLHKRLTAGRNTRKLFREAAGQINWFRSVYSGHRKLDAWLIYLMALTDKLSTKETESILKLYAFRRGETKRIISYKNIGRHFLNELMRRDLEPARVFGLLNSLSYEVIILIRAKFKDKNIAKHISDFFGLYNSMRLHVTGHDLKVLGIEPGPSYQKILERVFRAKLNGHVSTKEEELEFIRRSLRKR